MTDNEIIKALECCIPSYHKKCTDCVYSKNKSHGLSAHLCSEDMRADALDLINRQKAEIERLKEKYSRTMDGLKAVLDERADHSEAIKEFAERLKEKGKSQFECCDGWVDFEEIDNLVKEMVGDV